MEDRKEWQTENSYARQEDLTFSSCDARARARVGTVLALAASAAGQDYDARGLDYPHLRELGQVFLLSRITLHFLRRPTAGERLTITTWEDGAKAAHTRRSYRFCDGKGEPCIWGRSEWILVDPESRKILRPSSFTARTFTRCPVEVDCPECRKIQLPAEGLEELGSHTVRYSELDGNGHFHSGHYGNLIWDSLPRDLQDREPRVFSLNYSREALLDEDIRLVGFREGADRYLMEGLVQGERCFACACEFVPEGAAD